MASSIPAPAPTEFALAVMQKTRPRGRRMPWLMRLGLGVVTLLAVLAVVAPWVVQDPERQSLRVRLKPPTLRAPTAGRISCMTARANSVGAGAGIEEAIEEIDDEVDDDEHHRGE